MRRYLWTVIDPGRPEEDQSSGAEAGSAETPAPDTRGPAPERQNASRAADDPEAGGPGIEEVGGDGPGPTRRGSIKRDEKQVSLLKELARQTAAPAVSIVVLITILVAVFTVQDSHRQARRSQEQAWRLAVTSQANFPGAMLDSLDLRGLYASGTDFSGASMRGTVLRDSTLSKSRFDGSDLSNADLERANLESASFRNASLAGADFSKARLAYADLRGADLDRADFRDADLFMADVRGVDLSRTSLANDSVSLVCSDAETVWPEGVVPRAALCQQTQEPPAKAASWSAGAYVTRFDSLGNTAQQVYEVGDEDQDIRLLVRFSNTGRTTLSDVRVIVNLSEEGGVKWSASKAVLINGNYPDGYQYTGDWLQESGSQVSVRIGDYGPNLAGVAYLTIDVSPTRGPRTTCGDHSLVGDVYVGPSDGEMLHVATSTIYYVSVDCD